MAYFGKEENDDARRDKEKRGFMKNIERAFIVLAVWMFCFLSSPALWAAIPQAEAQMMNTQGRNIGSAQFSKTEEGVMIKLNLRGLEPGVYAVHIHDQGTCAGPDFKSAGEHFNPLGKQHGFLNPEGPHAGDLPNIMVQEDGTVRDEFVTGLITLDEGEPNSILDKETTLVIHSAADDYVTEPSGDSGDRVSCGPIQALKE